MISRVFKRTVFAAVVAAGILAGTAAHATTLDDVYRAVAQGTRVEAADAKAAVDAMRASAAAAGAARDEAARTKKSLEAEVAALEEAVSAAQERVRERRAKLEKERASVEAVLASIERHEGLLTESVMKTQIGRSKAFMDDAPVSKTDGVARLRRHWVRALGAVAGSAGVRTVEDAVIYDAAGAPSRGTVTLYGPFAAKAGDGAWLRYLPSERAWRRLADDPGIPAGVVALDPSFGRLLAGYAERHSGWAWMKPAGVIGIFIGLVAAAALLLGFLRWTALALEERRVRRQLEDMENPREDNSLGRMLAAAKESTDELLEAKLDAAIVAERPGFERGVATLAVLAGIPTLLGLLGTVSGMIETFTVMSEHGSAEPGLLAGGIAEALVTTSSAVSAIPILLLHCAVKTKRDAVFSHLEEAASTLAVREAAAAAAPAAGTSESGRRHERSTCRLLVVRGPLAPDGQGRARPLGDPRPLDGALDDSSHGREAPGGCAEGLDGRHRRARPRVGDRDRRVAPPHDAGGPRAREAHGRGRGRRARVIVALLPLLKHSSAP